MRPAGPVAGPRLVCRGRRLLPLPSFGCWVRRRRALLRSGARARTHAHPHPPSPCPLSQRLFHRAFTPYSPPHCQLARTTHELEARVRYANAAATAAATALTAATAAAADAAAAPRSGWATPPWAAAAQPGGNGGCCCAAPTCRRAAVQDGPLFAGPALAAVAKPAAADVTPATDAANIAAATGAGSLYGAAAAVEGRKVWEDFGTPPPPPPPQRRRSQGPGGGDRASGSPAPGRATFRHSVTGQA